MRTERNKTADNLFYYLPLLAGLFCLITGVFTLAGWLLDEPVLRSLIPGMLAMKVNTAVCFILLGLAAIIQNSYRNNFRQNTVKIFLIAAVLIISSVTLVEYTFRINAGIDEIIMKDVPSAAATSNAGRMSPITAVIFILLSASLLIFHVNKKSRISQSFTLLAFSLSYMASLGYLYGERIYSGVVPFSQIALSTSLAFFILSIGILILQHRESIRTLLLDNSTGSYMLRRLIPAVFLIPALIGILSLYAEHTGFIGLHFNIAFIASASTVILLITVWINAKTINKISDERSRVNRLYDVLNQINQLIVRCRDTEILFKEACNIIVEHGKFRMAWLGINDYEAGFVKIASCSGYNEGYLDKLNIPLDPLLPTAKGPTGIAAREGEYFICNDIEKNSIMVPWRERALKRGYLASAAFPIIVSDKIFGVLTIYGSERDFFKDDEVRLLKELTSDIAYALEFIEHEKEKLRAQEELKKLNAELERRISERTEDLSIINKELESFSYSVSHDLRTPLRHIDGYINLLKRRSAGKLDSKSLEFIDIVSASSRRMAKLIDELLAFSKMGRAAITKKSTDMHLLINEVIGEMNLELLERDIKWTIGELPTVYADTSMLRLVVMNLISNALKFTKHRETAEISIESKKENDFFIFSFKDNGAGFDMEASERLFGVFQRLHSEVEFEGTGIGLANVRKIITRHGGKTWAEGYVDKGATFYFSLPISAE